MSKISVRPETPADFDAVERLTYNAFQTMTYPDGSRDPFVQEHYLIHVMRCAPAFIAELDLVGEIDGEIVAHIAYTKSRVVRPDGSELDTITFAATREQAKALPLQRFSVSALEDEPAAVVSVVRYVVQYGDGKAVDPISAILSLSDDEMADPRIGNAIEEIKEKLVKRNERLDRQH